MSQNIYILLIPMAIVALTGCGGTKIIAYTPNPTMSAPEANLVVEQLMMTQPKDWRPDYVAIEDNYILMSFGAMSHGNAVGVVNNGIAVGSASSRTRAIGDRLYFSDITSILVLNWRRDWYLASVDTKRQGRMHLLRSHLQDDAQNFADALATLIDDRADSEIQGQSDELIE